MRKFLHKTFAVTMVMGGIAYAAVAAYRKYKEKAEHYEMQKLVPGAYQCSYYKDGVKYMAIADTEEKALERAKEVCASDDKK